MVLANLRHETAKAERAHRAAVRMAWVTALVSLVILSGLGGIALAAISPH
jgi:CHASE3 domain sensor protein